MVTYKEIQEYIKKKYGFNVKTCWIAHVKEICDLNPKTAINRFSFHNRENPCPASKIIPIMEAFSHFRMI